LTSLKLVFLMSALSFLPKGLQGAETFDYPFGNRIVNSQTPEIGTKWHGGVKMNDLLDWDLYWNAGDWLTIDFMTAGVTRLRIKDQGSGSPLRLTDYLRLFSIKSRPFTASLLNSPYKIAGGITFYNAAFRLTNEASGEEFSSAFRQSGLFIVQSLFIHKRHYLNFLASLDFHKISDSQSKPTLYFIPGYRCFFGKNRRWSFDAEYYWMNPIELPIKTLQIVYDADGQEFFNGDQQFVSFMFWGFSYSFRHLRLEAHLGNHISFAGPIVPMLGAGWDF
jgi:hypothetical protein